MNFNNNFFLVFLFDFINILYLQIHYDMASGNKEFAPTFHVVKAAQWMTAPYLEEERGKPDGKFLFDSVAS